MSLFLPILLLGFAQVAGQSVASTALQHLLQSTEARAVLNSPKFAFALPAQDVSMVPRRIFLSNPGDQDQNLCFTMRTYFFQRRNGFAPEPVGMTTCQPASARKQKRVTGKARLIPAN